MRLKKITVRNFRGLGAFEAETDQRTLFLTGLNGSGKSTVLQAVQMALFGRCCDAAGKRIVMQDLVGPLDAKAVVVLWLEIPDGNLAGEVVMTLTVTRRSQTLTVARPDRTLLLDVPQGAVRDAFWGAVGVDRRYAEVAANPRAYILGDDITDLLLELCGTQATPQEIRAYAGPRWNWLEGWINGQIDISIPRIAETATEQRRRAKQDLEALRKRREALGEAKRPRYRNGKEADVSDLPAVREALGKVRQKLDRAKVDLECARRAGAAPVPDLPALEAALEAAREAHRAANAELCEASVAKDAALLQEANLNHEYHRLSQELKDLKAALRRLEQQEETVCRTCGAKWTAARRAEQMRAIEERLSGVEQARADLETRLRAAQAVANESRTRAAGAQDAQRSADCEVEKAQKALEDGKAAQAAYEAAGSLEELEGAVAALEEQAATGAAMVESLERLREAGEIEAEIACLMVELDNLEWAVETFRDGRFQASRMTAPKEAFEGFCNQILGRFGATMQVAQRDGAVRVEVRRGDVWVPVPQLSKGERVLVEAAVALAYGTGAIICLDDLDALDSRNKAELLKALKASGSMVVCAGAWGLRDQNLEPLKAFLGGSVAWLGAGAAQRTGVAA